MEKKKIVVSYWTIYRGNKYNSLLNAFNTRANRYSTIKTSSFNSIQYNFIARRF